VDDAAEVHVDDPVPVLEAVVLRLAADADAGVVEQEVEAAVAAEALRDDALDA
jgi:hypothetical protein